MNKIHIIEAGAGSGKTYRLADEIFKALTRKEGSPVRPDGFILTTFTRKAAAELLSRVSKRLIDKGRSVESRLVRQSLIGTVNSVCGTILQRFAFEAGLSTRIRVIPEGAEKQHFNAILSGTIGTSEFQDLQRLAQVLSIEDWRDRILDIVNTARSNLVAAEDLGAMAEDNAKSATEFLPEPAGDRSTCMQAVEKALGQLDEIIAGGKDTTNTTANAAGLLRDLLRTADTDRIVPWQMFHKLSAVAAGKRSGADNALHNVRLLACGHHTWPDFKKSLSEYLHLVFEIAGRSMNGYAEWKRKEELVDFIDQEVLLLRTLGIPEVRKTLREELDMVLVDEFQDTSPIQLALFLKLAECAKESIWVGDPKQAIYGFRNADPELMFAAIDGISKMEGAKPLDRLDTSYRSLKPLVDFVNDTFGNSFEPQSIPAARVILKANRIEKPQAPCLESWVLNAKNKGDDVSAITSRISYVLANPEKYSIVDKDTKQERPILPKDIAVLCRTNDACDLIADQLATSCLPVERAAAGLMSEPEIQLILSGFRLLIDPDDVMAAAQITYLTEVVRKGANEEKWLEARICEVTENKKNKESTNGWNGHDKIKILLQKSGEMNNLTPRIALQCAADLTDSWGFAASMDKPQAGIANINRLFAFAEEYEENCVSSGTPVTAGGLVQFLEGLQDVNEDRIAATGGNAVRVMTWHAAKGLEWPMVILYTLDSKAYSRLYGITAFTKGNFDLSAPVGNRGILHMPFPYDWKSRNATAYFNLMRSQMVCKEAEEISENEWLRLLYVVFTRARDYLVFAARRERVSSLEYKNIQILDVPQDPANAPDGWSVIQVSAAESSAEAKEKLPAKWFPYQYPHTERLLAVINPSKIEKSADAKIIRAEILWEPLPVLKDADKEKIGSAIHAYLAVDTSGMVKEDKTEISERIIRGFMVESSIEARTVADCGDMIDAWIARHWAKEDRHREWPLVMVKNGFTIEGQADVVLESPQDFSIIDYKTATGSQKILEEKAQGYFPQVCAYAEAVALATGKTCKEIVVCFPLGGIAVFLNS